MDKKNQENAGKLFKQIYGEAPADKGLPVVEIYEKQGVYLYATSANVIKTYKMQQNILRCLIPWSMRLLLVAFFVWVFTCILYQNFLHPLCIAVYIFLILGIAVYIVANKQIQHSRKIIKPLETIVFLSY